MTRAEFADIIKSRWMKLHGMKAEESFGEFLKRRSDLTSGGWKSVADVATNDFDPEPVGTHLNIRNAVWKPSAEAMEAAQEAAKRSRPFVGSHNLPYDSDWDG